MPYCESTHPHSNTPQRSGASDPDTFQPALTQLRYLRPPDLEQLVRSWLTRCGFRHLRRCEALEPAITYHALVACLPMEIGIRFRIHQRQSRLQVHHVEAFAGHLLRAGVSVGVLISTGEITPEARQVADAYRSVRLRLYSGREFAEELNARRLGLRQISLWHWVLDLTGNIRRRFHQEER